MIASPGPRTVVEIRTGARLHFGLLRTKATEGRLGGIGMMIDRPGFVLRGRLAEQEMILADAETADRIRRSLQMLRADLEPWPEAAGQSFRFEVDEALPSHRGFGSGTQLAIAVASVVSKLLGFKSLGEIGTLDRGTRSAVGTWGCFRGGFVVDPGLMTPFDLSRHILAVPEEWRVVIVDPTSKAGISGSEEKAAFAGLDSMPAQVTERLIGLVDECIVPGLVAPSFDQFASGVTEFNRVVGEQFAPVQGGVYAHPLVCSLSQRLAASDWPHMAQSSWGPAAAIFCESETSAVALCRFLAGTIPADAAEVYSASPRNRGADVTLSKVP